MGTGEQLFGCMSQGCPTGCGCEICAPCPTESCTESCSVDEGITVDCYVW
ncbi:MAG: hypothetical protein JRI68_04820 [Deltaproteobacteria bacterium]|nr:hypothetical protein [Deltaproteobacteria bacterium]